ncbi:MAG: hypothetical protein A2Y33_08230 [Spirochaetes bacterium GWF1_51_8]|nr:MAG: hypothetical protein A2Y33_08230 [Spirochaetes bacterium GWF1_51_8]
MAGFVALLFSADLWGIEPEIYSPGGEVFITCPQGLDIHSFPSPFSEKTGLAVYGDTAVVLKDAQTLTPVTIDHIAGYWVYAGCNGQKGYLFSGYLCVLPPPPDKMIDSVSEYLDFFFKVKGGPETKKETFPNYILTTTTALYDNGITSMKSKPVYQTGAIELTIEVYFFPMLTRIEQVFVLLSNLGYFQDGFGKEYPSASQSAKENSYGYAVTLSENRLTVTGGGKHFIITWSPDGISLEIRY